MWCEAEMMVRLDEEIVVVGKEEEEENDAEEEEAEEDCLVHVPASTPAM